MIVIRQAQDGDREEMWQKMGFEIAGTLPQAFDHAALGLVDAHVMYRLL